MNDDELMDQLLTKAMTADQPQLSSSFDARLMRRLRPRRLTSLGRIALTAYGVLSAATMIWLMQGLRVELIGLAAVISVAAAAGVSAYLRSFAPQ